MYTEHAQRAIDEAFSKGRDRVIVVTCGHRLIARIRKQPDGSPYLVADTEWARDVPLLPGDIDCIISDVQITERPTTPAMDPKCYGYRSGP